MSYAGKVTRSGRRPRSTLANSTASSKPARAGRHVAAEPEADWQQIALFAGGVALGIAVGAGAALMFAPHSGAATRHAIVRRGRRWGHQAHDAWDDFRNDLRQAARRGRRRVRRRLAELRSDRDIEER